MAIEGLQRGPVPRTVASGGPHAPRDQGRSYTTLPSRSAALRTVPTTCPLLAISSGVVTMMSLLTGRSPNTRRISIAARRLSETVPKTTSKSTSLHSPAVPRPWEPKSTTRDGSKRVTMRSTMVEMIGPEGIVALPLRSIKKLWRSSSRSQQACFRRDFPPAPSTPRAPAVPGWRQLRRYRPTPSVLPLRRLLCERTPTPAFARWWPL